METRWERAGGGHLAFSEEKIAPKFIHITLIMGDEANDEQYAAEITSRASAVDAALSRKDKKGAMQAALQRPPTGTKVQALKDRNSAIVEKVIASMSDSDAQGVVDSLDTEELDVLMKYLYRVMGKIDKSINYSLLLKMHAMVNTKAGSGSIVRSLTDRKQV